MKVFSTVAAILGILHGSNGYVLDKSCDPYKQMVIDGMSSAFDMAQAGSDTLTQLSTSGSGAVWDAQKDLVSYLFSEALTNGNIDKSSSNWGKVSNTFSAVLKYNNNQGQPQSTPSDYRSLDPDSLVVYCDYSRFTENKDCDGNEKKGIVCDTNIGISWPMNSIYSDCKSTSKLSTTSVEVSYLRTKQLQSTMKTATDTCLGMDL
ncbi:hypothetical protein EIK77_004614 [Talaromyces pinophilus]|nr:hypothetical protein EIK77_004614 [Talaromyces pinophilus]